MSSNKLKKMYDLPIIYFSFDEQSGVEGMRTRLEAFVDLMHSRRNQDVKTKKVNLVNNQKQYGQYGNHFCHECIDLIQTK